MGPSIQGPSHSNPTFFLELNLVHSAILEELPVFGGYLGRISCGMPVAEARSRARGRGVGSCN